MSERMDFEGPEQAYHWYLQHLESGEKLDLEALCRMCPPAWREELENIDAGWKKLGEIQVQLEIPASDARIDTNAGLGTSVGWESPTIREVLERLLSHASRRPRYEVEDPIGEGGMGVILNARDRSLRRDLAMKTMRADLYRLADDRLDRRKYESALARFVDEAQITAQLSHPGIVPVHDMGLDAQGRVYFTMARIGGQDLREIVSRFQEHDPEWSLARTLGILLRVCETMSYAHSRGVLHRDLKPENVRVGTFGEVYVIDWGLAFLTDRSELGSSTTVETDRRLEIRSNPTSFLASVPDKQPGTLPYMSPEQSAGDAAALGHQSDVYSVGAMLYELLTGHPPYDPTGKTDSELRREIESRDPKPIEQLDRNVPSELVAICESAMARNLEERYGTMDKLQADLQAFLDRRVVKAYETGPWAEFRKWVTRNKTAAASLAAAILAIVGGLAFSGAVQAKARDDIERNSRFLRASYRKAELPDLWPAHESMIPYMQDWLRDVEELLTHRPEHAAALRLLEESGTPDEGGGYVFGSTELQMSHDRERRLVETMDRFGGVDGQLGDLDRLRRRMEYARTVEEQTVTGETASKRWSEARASIANEAECPLYEGLEIAPQLGLLPVRKNPTSGLWEFLHVLTGAEPEIDASTDEYVMTDESGMILVLVPGGKFWMGAQPGDPLGRNYDPEAVDDEGPVHEILLDPFFISKYEMSQGQWQRVTGFNLSAYRAGNSSERLGIAFTFLQPIEMISWEDASKWLARMELTLPTEAQWEYAARAGTRGIYGPSDDKTILRDSANIADQSLSSRFQAEAEAWDDGATINWAVHLGTPNDFGLHNTIGNVWEMCLDYYGSYELPVEPGTGLRQSTGDTTAVGRGGCCLDTAFKARICHRGENTPRTANAYLGVRPARRLTR